MPPRAQPGYGNANAVVTARGTLQAYRSHASAARLLRWLPWGRSNEWLLWSR
jgi:hypothetical protein